MFQSRQDIINIAESLIEILVRLTSQKSCNINGRMIDGLEKNTAIFLRESGIESIACPNVNHRNVVIMYCQSIDRALGSRRRHR